jgi:hypothetical protein
MVSIYLYNSFHPLPSVRSFDSFFHKVSSISKDVDLLSETWKRVRGLSATWKPANLDRPIFYDSKVLRTVIEIGVEAQLICPNPARRICGIWPTIWRTPGIGCNSCQSHQRIPPTAVPTAIGFVAISVEDRLPSLPRPSRGKKLVRWETRSQAVFHLPSHASSLHT